MQSDGTEEVVLGSVAAYTGSTIMSLAILFTSCVQVPTNFAPIVPSALIMRLPNAVMAVCGSC